MNILIINTNRYSQPMLVMPVGACMVAEAAERAGHRVMVLDLMFERDPLLALEVELKNASPDIVGLSVRNIDNNDIQNPVAFFEDLVLLVDTIRSRTQATIVLGGPAIPVMPEELLRYTGANWAVLGDGEVVFPKLLAAFSQDELPNQIPNIAWLENNVFRKNPGPLSFSDDCSFPDLHHWLDVDTYLSGLSTVPIQTKRGCPFKCVYCTCPIVDGHYHRLYTPESVTDAIKKLSSLGLRDIEFVDNVFNSPYEHAMAICEGLARTRLNVRLQSLELNPLFIDDALINAMEQAGFVGIGITVESASDVVLDGLCKGFTVEYVHHAAHVIQRHKLPCLWIFMFGGPGETKATVRETLRFAESCIRPKDVAFFNVGIRIYPGTELEHIARKEGILTLSPKEMLEPVFYISPMLDLDWLIKELHDAMVTHPNYISSDSIGLPFLSAIHRLGYRLGIRPPLWRYMRSIRRGLRFLGVDV